MVLEAAAALSNGFAQPYTDVDEWRDLPVRHRYVHGGFADSDTLFSFYFPPAEQYRNRFFQHLAPVPGSERAAQGASGLEDKISMAIRSGAYLVETNGGGAAAVPGSGVDPTIGAYRAHAAAAEQSRVLAQAMYGPQRPFGYAYGGSGGGFRVIGCAENTIGVWDGFVPYVIGSPQAIPNVFSVRMHAMRVLRPVLDRIVDAVEPGGNGDPYAGLDQEQREALREVTRMGFPLRAWSGHRTMGTQSFGVLYPTVAVMDPQYFIDFWTEPGYLGSDPTSSIHQERLRHSAVLVATTRRREVASSGQVPSSGVDQAFKGTGNDDDVVVSVRIDPPVPFDINGSRLTVRTGAAAGALITLSKAAGDTLEVDFPDLGHSLEKVRPGDEIDVDNSDFLAAQTYHRHQVPDPEYAVWEQFRGDTGQPLFPQRPMLLGPVFAQGASGTVQSGAILGGKMIVVSSLLDREAFPWQADWYRRKVREHLGAATDEHFRLWYTDHALHADEEQQEDPTHTVSYLGILHQALRDVAAWVEDGVAPAESTSYTVEDGQVSVPAGAQERKGLQPVLTLTTGGGKRADIAVGELVTVNLVVEVPPGGGRVLAVKWHDGQGDTHTWRDDPSLPAEGNVRVVLEKEFVYSNPGEYFVTAHATARRVDGESDPTAVPLENLDRVRVVVR